MLERHVEDALVQHVAKAGGRALKFVSPGSDGQPDRLCLLPGGKILFVELKAPGKKPTPLQAKVHDQLRALGFDVYVADSKEAVRAIPL